MKKKTKLLSLLVLLLVMASHVVALADNISTNCSVGTTKGILDVSSMGAATYTIPISCPKGYGKVVPNIALAYNSQAGYGLAGYGFSLSGISVITRGCKSIYYDGAASGVSYTDDDAYFLDGKRLVYQSVEQGETVYAPEGEPFTKVILHDKEGWLEVKANDGLDYCYGKWTDSRQTIGNSSDNPVNAWYLTYVSDSQHRFMRVYYLKRSLSIYPSTISYGMNGGVTNTIRFTYENIKNKNTAKFNVGGMEDAMLVRLKNISTETNSQIFRKYECVYDSTLDASGVKYSRLTQVIEKNGKGESLNPIRITWKGLPNASYKMSLPEIHFLRTRNVNSRTFYSGDVNGDGLCDVIEFADVTDDGNRNVYATYYLANPNKDGTVNFGLSTFYKLEPNFSTKWISSYGVNLLMDIDGDGINEMASPTINCAKGEPATVFTKYYKYGQIAPIGHAFTLKVSDGIPLFVAFDADKDGKDEFIGLEVDGKEGKYAGFFDKLISGANFETTDFTLSLPQQPKRLFVGDYNNDGLTDILVLYQDGYTIFYNQGGQNLQTLFDDNHKYSSNALSEKWRIEQGDFDGDGLVDFAYVEKNGELYLALNKGNGGFAVKYMLSLSMVEKNTGKDDDLWTILPCDFDGDGKTDLLVSKADFKYHGGLHDHYSYRNTQTAWLRSDGNKLYLDKAVQTDNEDDARNGYIIVGDFNGDGLAEIVNYGKNIYEANSSDAVKVRMYSSVDFNMASGRIAKITDGLGNENTLNYASLMEKSVKLPASNDDGFFSPNFPSYPILYPSVALPVVKTIQSNGQVSNYQYGNLNVHVLGKGMLGFDKLVVKNETTGETVEKIIESWDSTYYVPTKTMTNNSIGDCHSEMISNIQIVAKNNTYFVDSSCQKVTDYDGNVTTSTFEYNPDYGYLTSQKTTYGSDTMYKMISYENYENKAGVYLPARIISTQKHEDASEAYVQKTNYIYDDYGQVTRCFTNAETPMVLVTTNTYDKFGNVVSSCQNGSGVAPVTHLYSYDPMGRYLIKTWQIPESSTMEYTYDLWGNVLTETDLTNSNFPLKTTYTYNGWGDCIKVEYPIGTTESKSVTWGTSSNERYCVAKSAEDKPTVKTWYDNKGREVRSEYPSLLGVVHRKLTTYNNLEQVTSVVETEGVQTSSNSYRYDIRGRLLEKVQEEKNLHTNYTYDNRTIVTTVGNKVYAKTMDAWGNIKKSTDPLTSVSYVYNSMGKPVEVLTCGTKVSMAYDIAGNRSSMTDPDAGTTTYVYGADGKLLKQTDSKGVETKNTYDELGRLKSCQVGASIISYEYGSQGNEAQKLVKYSCGGKYEEYTYDKYGRMIQKVRNAYDKQNFTTQYLYNGKNQLAQVVYPGGLAVSYSYDQNGYQMGAYSKGLVLDSLMVYDGLVSKYQLPYGMMCKRTLDARADLKNLCVEKGDFRLFDMNFAYDSQTGNLLSRTGMLSEKEKFEYDELDRLVSSKIENETPVNISYADNGNILTKTNVGNYAYGIKPHAVMSIDNIDAYSPDNTLFTKFNEMGKIDSIEISNNPNSIIKFVYGPDKQLWNMNYIPRGPRGVNLENKFWSRYYDEGYEKNVLARNNVDFYYLTDNVIATCDKDGNYKFYIVAKDNLGSIVCVFDSNATKVFSACYDAWGKQTITLAEGDMKYLLRGYCGHEMLEECSLINMKGRLYDPVLGRFLSPDNYVQMPDNSQNFNRYSYCLNNPLKYTDPSGELFGIDDGIWAFAFFGATSNAILAKKAGKSPWTGALVGGFSSLASSGVGSLFGHGLGTFGHELLRAGAHGLTSGTLNLLNGDKFFTGAASGFAASLMGSGAQSLGLGTGGVLSATSIGGGIGSLVTGSKFMDGFRIGFDIGALNHNGKSGKVITIERELPPVECVADDLSYRKTFGYWLLGVGSGVSSGPYRMWNPDAVSFSVGGNLQITSFHVAIELGMVMAPGKLYPYINYSGGFDFPMFGFDVGASANIDLFVNKSDTPFNLANLEGYGYSAGANLGAISFNYGTGVDFLGLPSTSQYESFGIGLGAGVGIYGNTTTTQYLLHY